MSVYKRGQTYWIDYYIGGKRVREAIGTREEARVALGERLQSKRQGCNPELRRIEAVSFKAHALEVLEKHYATMKSHSWAKLVIKKHLIPRFGAALVGNITPKMVSDYMHDRTVQGMERATVDGERAILSCVLSFAVKWRRLHRDVNPMREVARLGQHNHRDRWLRPEEQRALIDAARARKLDYLADVIVFGLGTGARPPKELFSVLWTDLDCERRVVRLRAETTKDGKPRDIPLNDAVLAMLEARRARTASRFSPFIFTRYGKQIQSIRTAWNAVRKDAGLGPEVVPYCMRHTFCTRYSHSGGEAKDLQALAGHADFRTTQNYLHTDQDHARATVNRMAADLAGVKQDGHKSVTGSRNATA
jgi:integrase